MSQDGNRKESSRLLLFAFKALKEHEYEMDQLISKLEEVNEDLSASIKKLNDKSDEIAAKLNALHDAIEQIKNLSS